jgi:hypothetical protein
MNAEALQWLALALLGAAMAGAFGAIAARSLFAMCMHVSAAGAAVAAVVLLLGGGVGGLATALLAAAWAPVLLLAAMLLSARAAKHQRSGSALLGWLAAGLTATFIWWPLRDLTGARAPVLGDGGSAFWIAPLLLVFVAICVGLLGYGERGAMTGGDRP